MVSVIPKHIAAFALGTDRALYRRYKDSENPDTKWTGWARVGGVWLHDPVTIKRIDGEVDIFMMDHNHGLQMSSFNFLIGHGLGPWKNLGGKLLSLPAVANSKGIIHTFHIGTDRALYHHSYDGTNHTPFERLDGVFLHTPAAVSAGEKEVSVFAVGLTDGLLHHYNWKSSSGWARVTQLPGSWAGTPSAVSDQDGCWDVFGIDPNGMVNHVSYRNGTQSRLETISGVMMQSVDSISWGPGRIDLLGQGLDSAIYHKGWERNTWGEWENLGGVKAYRPTAVSHSPGALCVIGVGTACIMYIRVRDPKTGGWGRWTDLGGTIVSRVA